MNAAYANAPNRRVLALAAASGVVLTASAVNAQSQPGTALPSEVTLTGIVRDMRATTQGGHADFQRQPTAGFGHYMGMVSNSLDNEGKPVFFSTGRRVNSQWKDSQGRNRISPKPYLADMPGDVNGSVASTAGGALTNATNFSQWFRDIPGVTMSDTLPITLRLMQGTDKYVFDDKLDNGYQSLGGFFPINNDLYGNYQSTGKNFHFTYELATLFRFEEGQGKFFRFIGDDDVWVYVDGKLVIDLGGVHSAVEQTINVDRMGDAMPNGWLKNGQVYSLCFFFAERHTTQSNFRIETNLSLKSVSAPTTTALWD
jgi:fibro-slime domain-containing protein